MKLETTTENRWARYGALCAAIKFRTNTMLSRLAAKRARVCVCVLLIAALALRFLPAELRRAIALRAVNLAAASSKSL